MSRKLYAKADFWLTKQGRVAVYAGMDFELCILSIKYQLTEKRFFGDTEG